MRESFFKGLEKVMKNDERVVLLTSDTGFSVLDNIRRDYKDRCYNVGIAEQNMIGVAAGLAMNGKIVYVYAIIPFVTMRCWEETRVDVCAQNLNVKLVGVGAGMDYCTLGPTHHAHEDIAVMRALPNMTILSPCDKVSAENFAELSHETAGPVYVRFERYAGVSVYSPYWPLSYFDKGLNIVNVTFKNNPKDVVIISTGRMVTKAIEVSDNLSKYSIGSMVVDLYRIKPLNFERLYEIIENAKTIVTIEEHSIIGGIGSAISEIIAEKGIKCGFRRIGLPDEFCHKYGVREFLHKLNELDVETMTKNILEMLK